MKKLLTLSETAERIRLTEKALRMRIFRGEFPFLKIGGRVLVSEEELEKFLTLKIRISAEEAAAKRNEAA